MGRPCVLGKGSWPRLPVEVAFLARQAGKQAGVLRVLDAKLGPATVVVRSAAVGIEARPPNGPFNCSSETAHLIILSGDGRYNPTAACWG